jgi:hypothetical protein
VIPAVKRHSLVLQHPTIHKIPKIFRPTQLQRHNTSKELRTFQCALAPAYLKGTRAHTSTCAMLLASESQRWHRWGKLQLPLLLACLLACLLASQGAAVAQGCVSPAARCRCNACRSSQHIHRRLRPDPGANSSALGRPCVPEPSESGRDGVDGRVASVASGRRGPPHGRRFH